jgi:HORMA domain
MKPPSQSQGTKVANELTAQQSLSMIVNLMKASVGEVCYLRNLFDENVFAESLLGGTPVSRVVLSVKTRCWVALAAEVLPPAVCFICTSSPFPLPSACCLQVRRLNPVDKTTGEVVSEGALWLNNYIEAAMEAVELKYLQSMALMIYSGEEDPAKRTLLESYVFDVNYPTERQAEIIIKAQGAEAFSMARAKQSAVTMVHTLIRVCQTLKPLPEDKVLAVKLYYNSTAPADYQPKHFVDASDKKHTFFAKNPSVLKCNAVTSRHHALLTKVGFVQDDDEGEEEGGEAQAAEEEEGDALFENGGEGKPAAAAGAGATGANDEEKEDEEDEEEADEAGSRARSRTPAPRTTSSGKRGGATANGKVSFAPDTSNKAARKTAAAADEEEADDDEEEEEEAGSASAAAAVTAVTPAPRSSKGTTSTKVPASASLIAESSPAVASSSASTKKQVVPIRVLHAGKAALYRKAINVLHAIYTSNGSKAMTEKEMDAAIGLGLVESSRSSSSSSSASSGAATMLTVVPSITASAFCPMLGKAIAMARAEDNAKEGKPVQQPVQPVPVSEEQSLTTLMALAEHDIVNPAVTTTTASSSSTGAGGKKGKKKQQQVEDEEADTAANATVTSFVLSSESIAAIRTEFLRHFPTSLIDTAKKAGEDNAKLIFAKAVIMALKPSLLLNTPIDAKPPTHISAAAINRVLGLPLDSCPNLIRALIAQGRLSPDPVKSKGYPVILPDFDSTTGKEVIPEAITAAILPNYMTLEKAIVLVKAKDKYFLKQKHVQYGGYQVGNLGGAPAGAPAASASKTATDEIEEVESSETSQQQAKKKLAAKKKAAAEIDEIEDDSQVLAASAKQQQQKNGVGGAKKATSVSGSAAAAISTVPFATKAASAANKGPGAFGGKTKPAAAVEASPIEDSYPDAERAGAFAPAPAAAMSKGPSIQVSLQLQRKQQQMLMMQQQQQQQQVKAGYASNHPLGGSVTTAAAPGASAVAASVAAAQARGRALSRVDQLPSAAAGGAGAGVGVKGAAMKGSSLGASAGGAGFKAIQRFPTTMGASTSSGMAGGFDVGADL